MVDLRGRKAGRCVGSFLICLSYPSHLYIAKHHKLNVCFRWPGLQLYPLILFSVLWGLPHIFLFSDTFMITPARMDLFFPGLMTVLLLFHLHGTGTILLCRMAIYLQILLGFPDGQLLESLCNFIPRIVTTLELCRHCCLFLQIAVLWMNTPGEVRKTAKINETVKQKNLATMSNVMECSSKCNDSLLNLK